MNNKTILQIPIDKLLREQAAAASMQMGFSSLQETVRVFLKQLASESVRVKFEPKAVSLSPKNDRRYAKMVDDVKRGKVKTKSFSNADELINYLTK